MTDQPKIIYTQTDEAPALATYSFLPIIQLFAGAAGVQVETRDISLSGRIIATFSDRLPEGQRIPDALAELGELCHRPEANIIKLPNISASMPQMKAAIAELQAKGYALPDYPEEPANDDEREVKARYDRVKGSAVNPVLRQGNSDRRAPQAVKDYARKHPHRMGKWSAESKTRVATMTDGDFRSSERSITAETATTVQIVHESPSGERTVLKAELPLQAGEVLDATNMSKRKLVAFLRQTVDECREQGLLYSLHMKATMMKVSDPIIFGHAVRAYFADVFEAFGDELEKLGVNVNNGLGDLLGRIQDLPEARRNAITKSIEAAYAAGPDLSMVNSYKGITNLHVPSDVIIDASMPAMIRNAGQLWDKDDQTRDTLAVIPDHSYAGLYQTVVDFCREHGAPDPTTMGSVPNVGLMAQKAEEYGSHDKTFEIAGPGKVKVVDLGSGATLLEHDVESGDIWRACQTKDAPIRDWVRLAVERARVSRTPAIFWLDKTRAHDAELIAKVERYLEDHDTNGLDIQIMNVEDATLASLRRQREGKDTISVTGNVLRDYLTDLFPILEVGTSAKMLSIVPLMEGGGLFETGAGGSAPTHVQQLQKENHLRWDSLGEFLALAASLEHLATRFNNDRARTLGAALDQATAAYLENNKAPSRKAGELDNRGSHFYVAMYWARALASDPELGARFGALADKLAAAETTIVEELNRVQGNPAEIGGYFRPDDTLTDNVMRPSATLNAILAEA
ncbi:MAG: NADP-dependent isocitrate dehydrogenase [Myxococcota bacterium]